MTRDLGSERVDYHSDHLLEQDVPTDPLTLFERWLGQALEAAEAGAAVAEPTAMVVSTATVGRTGSVQPRSRTVLLKEVDRDGFVFFTNHDSAKGAELQQNPHVALHFGWYALYRQVRVQGVAAPVERARSEAYFATRPRGSQLGAWASRQSSEVTRDELDADYAAATERFAGRDVPCPPHWGGFRVRPAMIEFWQGQPSRMHDRLVYERSADRWTLRRLAP